MCLKVNIFLFFFSFTHADVNSGCAFEELATGPESDACGWVQVAPLAQSPSAHLATVTNVHGLGPWTVLYRGALRTEEEEGEKRN